MLSLRSGSKLLESSSLRPVPALCCPTSVFRVLARPLHPRFCSLFRSRRTPTSFVCALGEDSGLLCAPALSARFRRCFLRFVCLRLDHEALPLVRQAKSAPLLPGSRRERATRQSSQGLFSEPDFVHQVHVLHVLTQESLRTVQVRCRLPHFWATRGALRADFGTSKYASAA